MSRPRGSKNKATLLKYADIDAQIAAETEAKTALETRIAEIEAMLADGKAQLKAAKKELAAKNRLLASMQEKKAIADAAAIAAAKEAEIQNAVQRLLESGQSLDDILSRLQ